MKSSIRSYKGLIYYNHEDMECIEIPVNKFDFSDEVFCINSLCHLVELTAYLRCRYLVFNKLNSDFELIPELYDFVKKIIYKQLKILGVKRIIFLAEEDLYNQFYKKLNTENSNMIGFINIAEAIDWIKQDQIHSDQE